MKDKEKNIKLAVDTIAFLIVAVLIFFIEKYIGFEEASLTICLLIVWILYRKTPLK